MAQSWRSRAGGILEISRSLLAQAEAGQWTDVVRLEAERRRLLERMFLELAVHSPTRQLDEEDARFLYEWVDRFREMDGMLTAAVTAERDRAIRELHHLNKSRKRERAYRVAAEG